MPPGMLVVFKPAISFLSTHAVDPDKRRYILPAEGPRHYIDLDRYGAYPFDSLPRRWDEAVARYTEDTLQAHGVVPWWIQTMLHRLTKALQEKSLFHVLKYAAELGHYIADAHVPLHASSNHNGQLTGQKGIHAFWESRIPELLAGKEWDLFTGKAAYIPNPGEYIWARILESAAAADTVLLYEKDLSAQFPPDHKYAFEERNGQVVRQYSAAYTRAYDARLKGMVERRMRLAIYSTACFWYTAWVNAGQPDLSPLAGQPFSPHDLEEFSMLDQAWRNSRIIGREHE